jgi:hypothetical protein
MAAAVDAGKSRSGDLRGLETERKEPVMEETIQQLERDTTEEERLVLNWRQTQLERLGVSRLKAEMFAGHVDWHRIAELIQRGCSPDLALEIVR